MKINTIMTAVAAAVLVTSGAAAAVPVVSDVKMTQRANSRVVDIEYKLANADAIVTLSIETNGVAIPDSAVTRLSGDVCKVVTNGANKSITWDAGFDWPEHLTATAKARVTAWSTSAPPLYCAVDLTGGASATAYPINYYTSAEALPYGGLTNSIYKSTRLVMRQITNGTFNIGQGTGVKEVTLSQNFYMGVFQVTQGQWFNVMGTNPGYFNDPASQAFRPVEQVSYYNIRENHENPLSPSWPDSEGVDTDSFMGRRAVCG